MSSRQISRRTTIHEIVDEILAEVSENRRPLTIFDLDSTLFNVSLRTQKIVDTFVQTFGRDSNMAAKFAYELNLLSNLKISPRDWGLRQAIERSGMRVSEEFGKIIREYWRKNFFSSDFLHADQPYTGSREAVDRLRRAGANIFYLTGRDELNMRRGTVESLKHWGFPLADDTANLIMKPVKGSVDDEVFKETQMQKLAERYREEHRDIWFFENEPVIIERVRRVTPFVHIVWVDTTHSGRAEAPVDLPIVDWQIE